MPGAWQLPGQVRDLGLRWLGVGEEMLNGYALSYERYYLAPMEQGGADPVFDVVTQICFPDRAAYDRCITDFMNNTALFKAISDDGDILACVYRF